MKGVKEMSRYYLGNLREWSEALVKLEKLRERGLIIEAQNELIRVLQYRKNWKLIETVLEYSEDITTPLPQLVDEIFNIITDYNAQTGTRIIAVHVMGTLLDKNIKEQEGVPSERERFYINMMQRLVVTPQPTAIKQAISETLKKIGAKNNETDEFGAKNGMKDNLHTPGCA